MTLEHCLGCGGLFTRTIGSTHPYMLSSPACWSRYEEILAREYSEAALLATHRLTVDTYAVQHPGNHDRRAVRSVGLHLARLMLQLDGLMPPRKTNDIMLGLSSAKASIPYLDPPRSFSITVADVPVDAPAELHIAAVQAWAVETWSAWETHHDFIRSWVAEVGVRR